MNRAAARSRAPRGFVLLEVMLAVAIFAIGIITLGRCVSNCLLAEQLKEEDTRVSRILANRMTEIEGGSIVLADGSKTEDLKGMGEGMKLRTTRQALKRKNEKGEEIEGIYSVKLELTWMSGEQEQMRELNFYVYPQTQR